MSKILVSGGAGFIGSHLTDKLIENGHEVVVLDNLSTGRREYINEKADFQEVDICDFEKIKPFFKGIDFVFHLAAIPRMPLSVEDPLGTSRVNIMGTLNVFKSSQEAGVKRIINTSSSSVYGNQEKLPLKEDMLPNPQSPYGLQKLVGEQFAKLFVELYSMDIVSLRPFNVYGPRLDFTSDYSLVLGKFLRLRKEGKPLTIFGDGEQTRAFCYVDDVVLANVKAMESENLKGGEVINVGSPDAYSINYIAELVGGEKTYGPERQGDVLHTQADIFRAKELLGWAPEVSFEQGVERVKKWFEQVSDK